MNKTIQTIGADIILLMIFGSIFFSISGCSMIDHPPSRKSYIVVEKPPFRILYVNDATRINDKSVYQILRAAQGYSYKNYKFNTEILHAGMNVSADQNDHESDTDSRSRTLNTNIKK